MKIEYCDKKGDFALGFTAGGIGSFSVLQGILSNNVLLIGFGSAVVVSGALNLKNSFDKATIVEANIAELTELNKIKTNYISSDSGKEKEFIGTIERFSNYEVMSIHGSVTNIRTTGFILKDTLVDLVDETGYSIPCVLPLKMKIKEGQKLNLSAYLRKIKMPDKTTKNGLVAYSLS